MNRHRKNEMNEYRPEKYWDKIQIKSLFFPYTSTKIIYSIHPLEMKE